MAGENRDLIQGEGGQKKTFHNEKVDSWFLFHISSRNISYNWLRNPNSVFILSIYTQTTCASNIINQHRINLLPVLYYSFSEILKCLWTGQKISGMKLDINVTPSHYTNWMLPLYNPWWIHPDLTVCIPLQSKPFKTNSGTCQRKHPNWSK